MVLLLAALVAHANPPRDGAALAQAGHRRYTAEHGRAEYRISGVATGTQTFEWDHFGWRERIETKLVIDIIGEKTVIDMVQWVDGGSMTVASGEPATATRTPNPIFTGLDDAEPYIASNRVLGLPPTVQSTGTEEHLGLTCEVWPVESARTEVCMYQGLSLRGTMMLLPGMPMNVQITAVDFEHVPNVSALTVPEDMPVTESDIPAVPGMLPF